MAEVERTVKLRRSNLSAPGYTRRRYGKGFRYLDADGAPLEDPETVARIRSLVIPPAWRDVWISPDPRGHIQAVGTDAAGRRQYRYHDAWRQRRDRAKHDRVLDVARRLPRLRATVDRHISGKGLGRERVLATGVRLLELGLFRVGGEEYAAENGTFGLATLRREHVSLKGGRVLFSYPAKGGLQRVISIADPQVHAVMSALRRTLRDGDDILGYRSEGVWYDVRSDDINDYLRDVSGVEMTAKDFRTWHATVLMAVRLALAGDPPESERARRAVVRAALEEVSDYLGNTPAVAERSYVDPRVHERYERGITIRPTLDRLGTQGVDGVDGFAAQPVVERAVLRMLRTTAA